MIQIRNVPVPIHRALKTRAIKEGKSLSDFLLHEVTALATRPTLEELIERMAKRKSPAGLDSVAAVREARSAR